MQKGRRNLEILIPAPRCFAVFYLKVLWPGRRLWACSLFLPTYAWQRSYSQAIQPGQDQQRSLGGAHAPGRRRVAGLPSVLALWVFLGINTLSSPASVSSSVKLRGSRACDSLTLPLPSWALDSDTVVNSLEHLVVRTFLCHPQVDSPPELFIVSLLKALFLPSLELRLLPAPSLLNSWYMRKMCG